jgi:hypothetical protein
MTFVSVYSHLHFASFFGFGINSSFNSFLRIGCSISQQASHTVKVILPTGFPHLMHIFLMQAHSAFVSLQFGHSFGIRASFSLESAEHISAG